jgi:hypothetical protein
MDIIQETGIDFKDFEQWCHDMGMAFARTVMSSVLSDIDDRILKTRDRRKYRARDVRPLTIKTLMGEVTVDRRLYLHDAGDGRKEHTYLLDKAISLDTVGRMSMGLIHRMTDLITECSYRAAAEAVSFLSGQRISHGGYWNAVQAVGARVSDMDRGRARAARHFVHKGTKVVKVLQEEFDGVWINMQGKDRPEKKRKSEMKLALSYEGVEYTGNDKDGKPTYDLAAPLYMAGFESAEKFFEKKEGQIGAVYDLDEIGVRLVNGDGGGWVEGFGGRTGCECHFQSDPFHIKRELVRAGLSEGDLGRVTDLIDGGDTDGALGVMKALWDGEADEGKKGRLGKAFGYLDNRKDSLVPIHRRGLALPDPPDGVLYGRMGTMESTVCGVVALRMKKRRASFTKAGATNLARLLCLKRGGKLDETIAGLSGMSLPSTFDEAVTAVISAAKAPKKDGDGYRYARRGGIPFAGAALTNGRVAVRGMTAYRGFADMALRF